MTPPLPFGTQLKKVRRAAGMTQAELAARAGYSTVFISMLERGVRQPIRSTFDLLPEALALSAKQRSPLERAADLNLGTAPIALEPLKITGRFLGAEPEHGLAAREQEMSRLATVLDAVQAGHAHLVFLVGEPGAGKTR